MASTERQVHGPLTNTVCMVSPCFVRARRVWSGASLASFFAIPRSAEDRLPVRHLRNNSKGRSDLTAVPEIPAEGGISNRGLSKARKQNNESQPVGKNLV